LLAKTRILQFLPYAIGALLVWAMVGCGGGSAGGGVGGGKVALKIAWPKPTSSRYIPPYSHSLSFSLYSLDTISPPLNLVINRPSDQPLVQTVTFNGPITAGRYTLVGIAKVGFNGLGDTVAKATVGPVLVPVSGTTTVALTLNTSLYSLDLQDMPLSLAVGAGKQLVVQVIDKDGNQLFLPDGALTWSLLFGGGSVSLSDTGFVQATSVGTARVRVSEVGADLYSEGDIDVTASAIRQQSMLRSAQVSVPARSSIRNSSKKR
jgi:hypothetical protein